MMKCSKLMMMAVMVLAAAVGSGEEKSSEPEHLSKKQWQEQFQFYFNSAFCDKSDFVWTCLRVTPTECKAQVHSDLPVCAAEAKLPDQVQLGEVSERFGDQIGRCLGRKLSGRAPASGKVNAKCVTLNGF